MEQNKKNDIKWRIKFIISILAIIVVIFALKPSPAKAKIYFTDTEHLEISTHKVYISENICVNKIEQQDVYLKIDTSKYEPKQEENIIDETEVESKEPIDLENQDTSKDDIIMDTPAQKPDNEPEQPKKEKPNYSADYVGRFKIPSVGVNVACYSGSAQSIVDASDSAAYFYTQSHRIIADHKHQGFNAIKSAVIGTTAQLVTPSGTMEYKCVAKMNGHNTGYSLTDWNGNSIAELYPGTLVTYTCNENWQNVTLVFWERINESEDLPEYDCDNGKHCWDKWEVAWELYDEKGNYYGWDKRACKLCGEEEWKPRENPSENCPPPEVKEPEEPSESTPPPIDETEPPTEPAPSEPTTPPEENNSSDAVSNEDETKSEEPSATEPPVIEETEPSNEETLPDNVVEVIG